MKSLLKLIAGTGLALGLTATIASTAGAQTLRHHDGWWHRHHVVFVQTDNVLGNQVVAYDRAPDGSLTYAATYATGGLGGALNGAKVDFLASQGSLDYDAASGLLFAVNAGSNSISVFSVHGSSLTLEQVLGSGGTFPSSITSWGDLVYVLNATNGGSVSGFRIGGDRLWAIPHSTRALGLTTPTDATQFTHTPGQVAFTPNGAQLVVTTKATTSAIDVYGVRFDGRLSWQPTVNVEPGAVPFAVSFDGAGRLVVADAGTNAVSTYWLSPDGVATSLSTALTGEAATCWIASAQGYFFASNAGSATVSTFEVGHHGALSQLGSPTSTDPGTVDAASTPDGRFLYVQTGLNGIVDEFSVSGAGGLTSLGSVTVPSAAGGEGIVAI